MRRPALSFYYRDGKTPLPMHPSYILPIFDRDAPDYPVIWLVKCRSRVPWGERVQLN
jgi:hypothetical protein